MVTAPAVLEALIVHDYLAACLRQPNSCWCGMLSCPGGSIAGPLEPSHKASAMQVAPQVEADPARVLMPTAASSAEATDAGGSAFEAVHGFTTADVLKDKRFRVRHQCASEGLSGNELLGLPQLRLLLSACLCKTRYAESRAKRLSG